MSVNRYLQYLWKSIESGNVTFRSIHQSASLSKNLLTFSVRAKNQLTALKAREEFAAQYPDVPAKANWANQLNLGGDVPGGDMLFEVEDNEVWVLIQYKKWFRNGFRLDKITLA